MAARKKTSSAEKKSREGTSAQAAVVAAVRALLVALDPRVQEDVKWNSPSFRTSDHFATLHLREPRKVLVILHLGTKGKPKPGLRERIPDPQSLLEWRGEDRAVLTLENETQLAARATALRKILRCWMAELP